MNFSKNDKVVIVNTKLKTAGCHGVVVKEASEQKFASYENSVVVRIDIPNEKPKYVNLHQNNLKHVQADAADANEQESIKFEPCNRFSVLIYESFNTVGARLNEYNYYTARNDLHTFEERLAHVCEVFNVDEANVYGITLCPNEELSGEETHEYAITMRDGTRFIHGVCYLFDFKSSLDEYMKEDISFVNPTIEVNDIVSIERVL